MVPASTPKNDKEGVRRKLALSHPLPLRILVTLAEERTAHPKQPLQALAISRVDLFSHPPGFLCEVEGMLEKGSGERLLTVLTGALQDYLAGRPSFSQLPLATHAFTPFTLKVFQEIQAIAFGQTVTYAALAAKIATPQSARAVGAACGRNPFLLILPCHRVIAKTPFSGYAAGRPLKELLLRFEASKPTNVL